MRGHADDLHLPTCSKSALGWEDVVSIGRGAWKRERTAVCDDSADAGPHAHPISIVVAAPPI